MSFAEIVLRLAIAVGGFLIFIAHALTIVALRHATCASGAASAIPGTAFFAFLSGLAITGVGVGLPLRAGIRWLALLALALAALAAWRVAPAVAGTTIAGDGLCRPIERSASEGGVATRLAKPSAAGSATPLERLWPLLQLGVLGAGALQALRFALPLRRAERAELLRRRSGGT